MGDTPTRIETAALAWGEDAQPESSHFGDIYFSRTDGLAETRFVFLHHNDLPDRWLNLSDNDCFVVGETGFGTGLNFLACWQAWLASGAKGRLHFVSAEKHPLNPSDLRRALALWPDLAPLAEQLIAQYPLPIAGTHPLHFDAGRVRLTLLIGDAADCYAKLDAKVDAWFLDGFAPAKNPAMWTPELFAAMARRSHAQTSFATFTAAAVVRNGLSEAGFSFEKVKGYGRKRHMLRGRFTAQGHTPQHWFTLPKAARPRQATVIGAGIAGAATARALAERGIAVTLFERHPKPAQEGSGNPQGALYLKLPIKPTPQSRIHLHGYQLSQRLLAAANDPELWQACGLLQLPCSADESQRQQRISTGSDYPVELVNLVDAAKASQYANTPLNTQALLFPGGGWLAPQRWCEQLLDHPLISQHYQQELVNLLRQGDEWQLEFSSGTLTHCRTLVIACAASATRFSPLAHLPLKAIRGQLSTASPAPCSEPASVLCGKGYVMPPLHDRISFGATFNLHEHSTCPSNEDHRQNMAQLAALAPQLAARIAPECLSGRVAFRCTTPDYLPMAGPVAQVESFRQHYEDLRRDAGLEIAGDPPLQPGLYVNLGHGSKGMLTAPLCAELLACQLNGEPLPLPSDLLNYLHPARFLIKELKQRSI